MIALIQRVSRASVLIKGGVAGEIGDGLCILLGIKEGDDEEEVRYLAGKVANMRIFNDDDGKMNLSVLDVGGSALVVSQFTLHADERKGRRPSFIKSAKPEVAIPLYELFIDELKKSGIHTESGEFGAMMEVELINSGPVTIIAKSKNEY
jgi:D-tyrosyl-tRNA(Tyr) deacylase